MYANRVRNLRRRLLIYTAGGPGANLLSVMAVVTISHLTAADSGVATAIGLFGAISLLLTMISLLPIAPTDGGLIELLLCSPLPARRFMSTVALGAQFTQGIRARNWKQTWVSAATYVSDTSHYDFYACWMAYLSASDRKDALLSAQYLERCLSLTPTLTNRIRSLVAQEAVVYSAWLKRDAGLANKWFGQVDNVSSLQPIPRARIEVALCCARSDFDHATLACEKALGLFKKIPEKPYIRALRESWLEWRDEIEERSSKAITI